MRKMASVVTVDSIESIEGKDKIVYIGFKENGYHVIGDKTFSIGEKIVYFEVDSVLPVKPEFEFLRKRCFNSRVNGFVIKNMKMSNLYSTGLILHFNEVGIKSCKAETDLTEKLGVTKLEDYADASPKQTKNNIFCNFMMKHKSTRWLAKLIWFSFNKNKGKSFPTEYLPKSDETNIQNIKGMFEKWENIPCYISRKFEGQSFSIFMIPNKKTFKTELYARNYGANENQLRWAEKNKIEDKLKLIWKNTNHCFAIQGEFCGPNIQKNIYKFDDYRFFVYTVKDITENKQLGFVALTTFCEKYNFETVKIVCSTRPLNRDFSRDFSSIDELQNYTEHQWFAIKDTKDKVSVWNTYDDRTYKKPELLKKPEFHRWEGIVVRGMNNEFSFKVKSNQYQIDGL